MTVDQTPKPTSLVDSGQDQVPVLRKIEFITVFLDKFWRNDRRNLQCFPSCPKFGSYKLHKKYSKECGSWPNTYCHQPVEVRVCTNKNEDVKLYGRFRELPKDPSSRKTSKKRKRYERAGKVAGNNVAGAGKKSEKLDERNCPEYKAGQSISKSDMQTLTSYYEYEAVHSRTENGEAVFSFNPANWKYSTKLPKTKAAIVSTLYCFEVVLVASPKNGIASLDIEEDKSHASVLSVCQTTPFKIANTRSLLRTKEMDAGSDTSVASLEVRPSKSLPLQPQYPPMGLPLPAASGAGYLGGYPGLAAPLPHDTYLDACRPPLDWDNRMAYADAKWCANMDRLQQFSKYYNANMGWYGREPRKNISAFEDVKSCPPGYAGQFGREGYDAQFMASYSSACNPWKRRAYDGLQQMPAFQSRDYGIYPALKGVAPYAVDTCRD